MPLNRGDVQDVQLVGAAGAVLASGDFDSVPVNEASTVLWVRAAVTGLDITLAATARNVPTAAHLGNIVGFAPGAEHGSVVNARGGHFDISASDWIRSTGDLLTGADGGVVANIRAPYSLAVAMGKDTTGATVGRVVEVRAAVADQSYGLNRLLVDSVIRGDDGADYPVIRASTGSAAEVDNETLVNMHTVALVRGYDSTQAAGDQFQRIAARAGAISPNHADALIGLFTNARVLVEEAGGGSSNPPTGVVIGSIGGANPASHRGMQVVANVTGVDNTGAAVLRAVEARPGTDAASWAPLAQFGLVINARLGAIDGAGAGTALPSHADVPSVYAAAGRATNAVRALWANALAVGVDNSAAAVMRPVEARALTNVDGATRSALVNLLTASSVYGRTTGNNVVLNGAYVGNPSILAGAAASDISSLHTASLSLGGDTTGAMVFRIIEGRALSGYAAAATSLLGLLTGSYLLARVSGGATMSPVDGDTDGTPVTGEFAIHVNSRTTAIHPTADNWRQVVGMFSPGDNANYMSMIQSPRAGVDLYRSMRNRAFRVGSERALVQGIAAFVTTTPDVLIVPAATNEWIIKEIRVTTLTQTGTVRARCVIDPDNRFSAGGTTRTPVNRNLGSSATDTPTRCLDGGPVGAATPITATAEDADERNMIDKFITAAFGTAVFTEDDGLIVAPAGSVLLYVNDNAGATAPTFAWEVIYELANAQ